MAFKRSFRRGFRRRRASRSETYTILSCQHCTNVYGDMTCVNPLIDSFPLMSMATQASATDTTHVSNPSDRFVVVKGIKFQSEYTHDPAETQGFPACDPNPLQLVFHLTIWEAIVVVPCAEGANNIPAYVPNLTGGINQQGDMADRVLWKRITQLPIFGLSATASIPQLTATERNTAAGPVVVKSRVRLDDRHMLLFVRNYTHNIATGLAGNFDCVAEVNQNPCVIPVRDLSWFKVFYQTRK